MFSQSESRELGQGGAVEGYVLVFDPSFCRRRVDHDTDGDEASMDKLLLMRLEGGQPILVEECFMTLSPWKIPEDFLEILRRIEWEGVERLG